MSTNKVILLAAGVVAAAMFLTQSARSDNPPQPPPSNIYIANPATIARDIRETKDLLDKMSHDQAAIKDQITQRQADLKKLQDTLAYLNPNTPDYDETNKKLLNDSIEYDAWLKETGLELQRRQKADVKRLFDEIEDAIAQVAQRKGANLVIADQRPEIPDDLENVDIRVLQDLISRRTILYSDQTRDISGEVTNLLDQNYLNRTAVPAPAPAPAPAPGAPPAP